LQVVFGYFVLNFALFFVSSGGYSTEHNGNTYFISDHGKIVREISESEYKTRETDVTRFFSAGWMAAYLPTLLYFAPRRSER
jgi:hypothetical protein